MMCNTAELSTPPIIFLSMPNWCSNFLTVSGPRRELMRFKKENAEKPEPSFTLGCEYEPETTELSLNKKVPLPTELINTAAPGKRNARLQKLYGASDWYAWQAANWGTKWDVTSNVEEINKNTLFYDFISAWSPPIQWLSKICPMYPKLHFHLHYEEPGNDFIGDTVGEGDEFNDECRPMTEAERNGETD